MNDLIWNISNKKPSGIVIDGEGKGCFKRTNLKIKVLASHRVNFVPNFYN